MQELKNYSQYPAIITQNDADGVCFTLRHENMEREAWLTDGENMDDAKKMAVELVRDAASSIAGKALIPAAAPAQKGDVIIDMPYDLALKIMLRNAMFEEGVRVSDIAKVWGVRPQKIFNLVTFDHATKLDLLRPIFDFIGRPLRISC